MIQMNCFNLLPKMIGQKQPESVDFSKPKTHFLFSVGNLGFRFSEVPTVQKGPLPKTNFIPKKWAIPKGN